MVDHFGLDAVLAYMQHVQDNAQESVRRVVDSLDSGQFEYALDNGSKVTVKVTVDNNERQVLIDFTGTSEQQNNNFNAPTAVVNAAVLYVFRTLVDTDIPLNSGCLKPIKIIVPEGCMLNPVYPAAVVAGNVETSQVIVDSLLGALNVTAGSQGTMNNFTFGNKQYQYYETICGGVGASPGHDGCSAVHSHMTNTRLTDPEIIELRYPVTIESFSIRHGSGGHGAYRGGDGIIRRICFNENMTVSILANRRKVAPFGLAGGLPGDVGRNYAVKADGTEIFLTGTDKIDLEPGDIFVIETPGGGGYGKP
jgi:5-oxoprolinase (ATP-hydrolysing)